MSGKLEQIGHRSGVEPVGDVGMSGRYSTAPDGSRIGAPGSDFIEIGKMFARKVRGEKPSLRGRDVARISEDPVQIEHDFKKLGMVCGGSSLRGRVVSQKRSIN